MSSSLSFIYFGTSRFSTIVLDTLLAQGYIPRLIVSTPDKPKGRKLVLSPSEVKLWAEQNNIPCITPGSLKTADVAEMISSYSPDGFDVAVVASYGKIIPQAILDIPKHGTLNVHPSLLPKLRGASPIQSAILNENETGVTIIQLDAEIDHGPIIAQEKVAMTEWPPYAIEAETMLAKKSGELLASILPKWVAGTIQGIVQDHTVATFCSKIQKADGLLDLADSPEQNLRKIRAYQEWPGAYFFYEHGSEKIRVIVTRARIEHNELILEKVIPEGRKEMHYDAFLRGLKK